VNPYTEVPTVWFADESSRIARHAPVSTRPGFAADISGDGSIVVGGASATSESSLPFKATIWSAALGERDLADLLRSDYGLASAFAGWGDTRASGISGDGLAITGYGTNPDGNQEAWLVILPEPASALLLAAGLAGLGAGSRRGPKT
jgi:hypothetical protein